jgi:hypothetical protein
VTVPRKIIRCPSSYGYRRSTLTPSSFSLAVICLTSRGTPIRISTEIVIILVPSRRIVVQQHHRGDNNLKSLQHLVFIRHLCGSCRIAE